MAAVSFTLPAYPNAAPGEGCAACSRVLGFHDEALVPILLGCGHLICFECLEPIFDGQLDNDGFCHCSQCPSPVVYARHPAPGRTIVLTARYNLIRQCAEFSIALHGEQGLQDPVFRYPSPEPPSTWFSTETGGPLPPALPPPLPEAFRQRTPEPADPLQKVFPQLSRRAETAGSDFVETPDAGFSRAPDFGLAEFPGFDLAETPDLDFAEFSKYFSPSPAPAPAPAPAQPAASLAVAPPAPAAPALAAPQAGVEGQPLRRSDRRHTLTVRAREFWDDVHRSRRGSRR